MLHPAQRTLGFNFQILNARFVAERTCHILPTSSSKNELHETLANEHSEEASKLIANQSDAQLLECFEGIDGCSKSCLHLIAAISDTEEATKLCRQLMQKVKNKLNREYLLYARTIEEFDMNGWKARACVSAVHIAAYSGNSGVVRLLCQDFGVDVNCSASETLEEKPKKGMTPLEWAARKGNTEVVEVLVDSKADVNARRTNDGTTPLYTAAYNGHEQVVKMLLDHKADVNARRTNGGERPINAARRNNHLHIVKLLQ